MVCAADPKCCVLYDKTNSIILMVFVEDTALAQHSTTNQHSYQEHVR